MGIPTLHTEMSILIQLHPFSTRATFTKINPVIKNTTYKRFNCLLHFLISPLGNNCQPFSMRSSWHGYKKVSNFSKATTSLSGMTSNVVWDLSQANYVNSLPICLGVDKERYIKTPSSLGDMMIMDAAKRNPLSYA